MELCRCIYHLHNPLGTLHKVLTMAVENHGRHVQLFQTLLSRRLKNYLTPRLPVTRTLTAPTQLHCHLQNPRKISHHYRLRLTQSPDLNPRYLRARFRRNHQ